MISISTTSTKRSPRGKLQKLCTSRDYVVIQTKNFCFASLSVHRDEAIVEVFTRFLLECVDGRRLAGAHANVLGCKLLLEFISQ